MTITIFLGLRKKKKNTTHHISVMVLGKFKRSLALQGQRKTIVFFLAAPCGLQNLSSPTRDQTQVPWSESSES